MSYHYVNGILSNIFHANIRKLFCLLKWLKLVPSPGQEAWPIVTLFIYLLMPLTHTFHYKVVV